MIEDGAQGRCEMNANIHDTEDQYTSSCRRISERPVDRLRIEACLYLQRRPALERLQKQRTNSRFDKFRNR